MAETCEMSFEQALARLEEIVEELDQGDLSLDEALARFQEGTRLKEFCEKKLAEAEASVEELLQETDVETDEETDGTLFGDQV